jgi:single-strand DNA-binding protein
MLEYMQQNTVTLIGAMATDVVLTTTDEGVALARFRVIVSSRRLDRRTSTWVNSEPSFVAVACWRRLAENVAGSLQRGDPVLVTGRLKVRSVQRNGRPTTYVEVEASSVGPDLNRTTATLARVSRTVAA